MIWNVFLISFWAVPCLVLITTLMLIFGIQLGPPFSLLSIGFPLLGGIGLWLVIELVNDRRSVNIKREAGLLALAYATLFIGHTIAFYAHSALGLGTRPAFVVANLLWLSLLAVLGHRFGFWNLRPQTPPSQAASS